MGVTFLGQTVGCRDGWINMEGRCVYYNIQRLSWLDARTFCRSLGGDLFTVESDADFDVVKTFTMGAWVGLNTLVDSVSPRVYTWSDGSAMTFTPWDVQAHNASLDSIRDINCGALTAKVRYFLKKTKGDMD
jgi:Lectin C-type domain